MTPKQKKILSWVSSIVALLGFFGGIGMWLFNSGGSYNKVKEEANQTPVIRQQIETHIKNDTIAFIQVVNSMDKLSTKVSNLELKVDNSLRENSIAQTKMKDEIIDAIHKK